MIELESELDTFLGGGGTLIVPTAQRAAAVRLAYDARRLRQGARVWATPDVLPWNGWIERLLDEARARGDALPRRLRAAEEWLLWREAVHEACADLGVLLPEELISSVRAAAALADEYGIGMRTALTAESALLLRARGAFRRRLDELQACWSGSWRDGSVRLQAGAACRLAGFAPLGPVRRRWLAEQGVVVGELPAAVRTAPDLHEAAEPAEEARAAAEWCAALLGQDPQARLLLVVPALRERRHEWIRALSQRLDYASLLAGDTDAHGPSFALEGGRPLSEHAPVASALDVLTLGSGAADFAQLSRVLRSGYFGARVPRLQLETWLRDRDVESVSAPRLGALLEPASRALEAGAVGALRDARAALELARLDAAGARIWAQRFGTLLDRFGWPGEASLSSEEQQARMRFEELLGDFAVLGAAGGRLSAAEATQLLSRLAADTAFEPASGDVPVTVTASLSHPIVRYDGIWVAGLSAEAWPQPARPDALLPLSLQRAAGVPQSSAAGQLQLALAALQGWQASALRCTLSWPRSEEDLPRERSPLLRAAPSDAAASDARTPRAWDLGQWLRSQAPALERLEDATGPRWGSRRLPAGTRLLELQSLCAFRAFAELRLEAGPLPDPVPGIDARLRGQLLHRAAQLFWRDVTDLATLRAQNEAQTEAAIGQCVQRASQELLAQHPESDEPLLWRGECERARRLLLELMQWERQREPFRVQQLEQSMRLTLGGGELTLRLDRLDRLDDGRLMVIDYKSGAAEALHADEARPLRPQLPAYAMAIGPEVAAVVAAFLTGDGLRCRGLADRDGRAPGAVAAGEEGAWSLLLERWGAQIGQLVAEFLSGHARVQPQPQACRYCHLPALCRIPARQRPGEPQPGAPGAGDAPARSQASARDGGPHEPGA